MALQRESPARLAFGPFQLDSAGRELRRNGVRVRLSGQPFRILLVLLAHPGELVSREQLRQEVWSKDAFVDFEHGLNAAVNKLRRALGDAAENPRYIETQPGYGYRFIGTVRHLNSAPVPLVAESPLREGLPVAPRARIRWWLAAAGAGLAFTILGGFAVWSLVGRNSRPSRKLTGKDTIVLADFANNTGEGIFNGTLRQGLAIQLQQSPFLEIMDDGQMQRALRLMSVPPGTPVTDLIAHEICIREGAAATIN